MIANLKYIFLLAIISLSFICKGQSDSIISLNLPNFLQLVKQNHPLAKKANLLLDNAEANTLKAKGGFDPNLFYDFRNKFYDSKNYYEIGNGGLEIPTWWGVSLKAGVENSQGQFVNPENNLPQQGLAYAQVSFSLLQGLVIDERRATLKQARVFEQLSLFEQRNVMNELMYKSGKTYWDWYLAFVNKLVIIDAVELSKVRLNAVIGAVKYGDRPAIDTVEANIQLQDRLLLLQQAELEYFSQSLLLSNYLWLENDVPLIITDKTLPDTSFVSNNDFNWSIERTDSLINNHPSLRIYDFKLSHLAIERKLKQEKLKPNLQLNYNPLLSAQNIGMGFQNNYKWGMSVGFPVLLRKERGELKMTNIKIEQTRFENSNTRNELINKTNASINAFKSFINQKELYSRNVLNYRNLWLSEKRLFDAGESSLFMINSREISYINAQMKLNEIINKNRKAALEVEYTFGLLGL